MKPRVDVEVKTKQGTRVVFAVAVAMYAAGVTAVLVGIVAVAVNLPPFPGGTPASRRVSMTAVSTANSVTVQWTAPGDDGVVGQATRYDLRYASTPITDQTFAAASVVPNVSVPRATGQAESFTVTGLSSAATYYFALKTADEVPNWSPLSNIATAATSQTACTPDWSCTDWSVCQDSQQLRTCVDRAGCNSTVGRPIPSQACTGNGGGPCTERWSCTEWLPCVDGSQSRVCADDRRCGTSTEKPAESSVCPAGGDRNPGDDTLAVVPWHRASAHVRLYDPSLSSLGSFFAARSREGATIALGDVDGDGEAEVIVGLNGSERPEVLVFRTDGARLARLFPFAQGTRGTPRVGAGDVDGDGIDEVFVAPTRGRAGVVEYRWNLAAGTFQRPTQLSLSDVTARNGFNFTLADVNHDSQAELIAVPAGNDAPTVRVFQYDPVTGRFQAERSFAAFAARNRQGLQVAAGDVDNDGDLEIVVARDQGAPPVVRVFSPTGRREYQFAAAPARFRGGVTVATLDANQDGQDEVVTAVATAGPPGVFFFRLDRPAGRFLRVGLLQPYPSGVRFGLRLAVFH